MIMREVKDPHGIKARREALGWSQEQLGKLAGTNGARVGQLERGETELSRYLYEIQDILTKAEETSPGFPAPLPKTKAPSKKEKLAALEAIRDRRMPVYDAQGIDTGGIDITGALSKSMRVPRSMEHVAEPYAVVFWGMSMTPKYHPKDILIVNPQSPPRPFGGVICRNDDRTEVCIGEYVSETEDEWVIARFGDAPEIKRLSRAVYPIIHAIVCVSTDLVSL